MSTLDKTAREELSLLLPWYANGTLSDEDNRRVEAALKSDAALASEYDLILEDQTAVLDLIASEEVPASMAERFKVALNTEIEASQTPAPVELQVPQESFVSRAMAFLFPTRPVAYMAVAAAFVICIQAGVLFSTLTDTQQTGQYETASGDEGAELAGTQFLVKIQPTVAFDKVEAFLKMHNGQILNGPTADGFYELSFKDEADATKLLKLIEESAEVFQFALPVQ